MATLIDCILYPVDSNHHHRIPDTDCSIGTYFAPFRYPYCPFCLYYPGSCYRWNRHLATHASSCTYRSRG